MKLKVIHIVEDLKVGGLERVVECIATRLPSDRFEIQVWAMVGGGKIAERIKKRGVPVHVFGYANCYNLGNIRRLARRFKKENPQIIHTHGYFASTIGRMAAILGKVPVRIVHYHTTLFDMKRKNIWIEKMLNRYTSLMIAVSEAVKTSYCDIGYDEDKIIVVYNGTDSFEFKPGREKRHDPTIINVASLQKHKGHLDILRAMKSVSAKYPNVKLWIVGDGPLRQKIQHEANRLELKEKVVLWGEREDVSKLTSSADLAVVASTREGLGLSAIEAMACGIPVIANKVGGLKEIVKDGYSGVLVDTRDTRKLGASILTLLGNPDLLKEMGSNARKRFEEKFDWNYMIDKIQHIYETGVSSCT